MTRELSEIRVVRGFARDEYVPAQFAIAEAAKCWFSHRLDAIEIVAAANAAMKDQQRDQGNEQGLAASRSEIPEAVLRLYVQIWLPAVERFRKHLARGKNIRAYYGLRPGDRREVPPEFWEMSEAAYTLDTGIYFPAGRLDRWSGPQLYCGIFFRKLELDLLLREAQTPRKPFPQAKKPSLVAMIRKLNHLTRKEQRQLLSDLPEFRSYLITDKVFRDAVKQAPRPRGRPRRR